MPSAPTRYFLAADRQSQCAVPMSDDLHRMIWGVASYSSQPREGVAVVTPADPLAWLEGQLAVRLGAENAAYRIGKVRGPNLALAESAVAERVTDEPRSVDWFGAACALSRAHGRDLRAGASA